MGMEGDKKATNSGVDRVWSCSSPGWAVKVNI